MQRPIIGSFFIPLEQGLKQNYVIYFTFQFRMFFLHSIRTRIKTDCTLPTYQCYHSSFFIPLDQGLKLEEIALIRFLLSSFFIPLEQGLKRIDVFEVNGNVLFFLHSIRTRIKTSTSIPNFLKTAGSFFIPLEQGLKLVANFD